MAIFLCLGGIFTSQNTLQYTINKTCPWELIVMVSYLLSIYKQTKYISQKITTNPMPNTRIIWNIVTDERISITILVWQHSCQRLGQLFTAGHRLITSLGDTGAIMFDGYAMSKRMIQITSRRQGMWTLSSQLSRH